jgi:hypothetical protein
VANSLLHAHVEDAYSRSHVLPAARVKSVIIELHCDIVRSQEDFSKLFPRIIVLVKMRE